MLAQSLRRRHPIIDCIELPNFHTFFVIQENLPEYFSPWTLVGRNVASLFEQHKLRNVIDEVILNTAIVSDNIETVHAYYVTNCL